MPASRTDHATSPHIAIIGTGFGGLCMAMQLVKAGIRSFTLFEKAATLGGTWRDNTYPGAACDVQSHLYSYSFEPKSDWSRKFGTQAEIREYLEDCAAKYGLLEHIRFESEVSGAVFDDARQNWRLDLATGESEVFDVVITACGQLNQPAYPNIPGRETFAGQSFHSARWDHEVDLAGRDVAVVGTGASAIQFVPQIVDRVGRLKLFQRSGAWVVSKPDRPFKPFEQKLFARFPWFDRVYRTLIYWKNESRALAFTRFGFLLETFAWMARFQAWRQMDNADKRRRLIPDYKIGCKRILLASDWYPAVDRDNLDLITDGIDHIESDAVVMKDGTRHTADVLIYGTGFHATDFLAPMAISGRNGASLNDVWRDGAEAYKGINVAGFPNLFMLYGPNTNLAHSSIVFMLESQVRYVMQCVQALRDPQVATMDVRADRQQAYNTDIQNRLDGTVWTAGCDSWYTNASGKQTNNWPDFTFAFRRMTAHLALDDYQLDAPRVPSRASTPQRAAGGA
ncbi:flavin-containing monooxygenase FMO [Salinisphaera dokdonensis CL-ES53]|uniref:Flavin-containing monooxygenase FMO n=1 Tax=Salinisphaera dokdonensis CL-ES53 TaxID=1304272 RepID=A0ABV2B4F1_9GAMM